MIGGDDLPVNLPKTRHFCAPWTPKNCSATKIQNMVTKASRHFVFNWSKAQIVKLIREISKVEPPTPIQSLFSYPAQGWGEIGGSVIGYPIVYAVEETG